MDFDRRSALTKQLVDQLRELIFEHNLKPGDRIPTEKELAKRFKVSRPTIRQALKALDLGGLITARTSVGTFVRTFDYDQIADALTAQLHLSDSSILTVVEAQVVIECGALRLLAQKIDDATLEKLRHVQWQIERFTEYQTPIGSLDEMFKLDEAFHSALLEASDNPLVMSCAASLRAFVQNRRHLYNLSSHPVVSEIHQINIRDHRVLIDALEARDLMQSNEILRGHLQRVLERFERVESTSSRPSE